jgi:hypothetical protein
MNSEPPTRELLLLIHSDAIAKARRHIRAAKRSLGKATDIAIDLNEAGITLEMLQDDCRAWWALCYKSVRLYEESKP